MNVTVQDTKSIFSLFNWRTYNILLVSFERRCYFTMKRISTCIQGQESPIKNTRVLQGTIKYGALKLIRSAR